MQAAAHQDKDLHGLFLHSHPQLQLLQGLWTPMRPGKPLGQKRSDRRAPLLTLGVLPAAEIWVAHGVHPGARNGVLPPHVGDSPGAMGALVPNTTGRL